MKNSNKQEENIFSSIIMFCQNSTIYFLKAFKEGSLWKVYEAEKNEPVLTIPQGGNEKNWQWNLSGGRSNFRVAYLV